MKSTEARFGHLDRGSWAYDAGMFEGACELPATGARCP